MNFEIPQNPQENPIEQTPIEKASEQIVDEAFGNLDNVKKFMDGNYGWAEKMAGEEKDKRAEEEKEGFAEC